MNYDFLLFAYFVGFAIMYFAVWSVDKKEMIGRDVHIGIEVFVALLCGFTWFVFIFIWTARFIYEVVKRRKKDEG